jgi:hypothetical protein
MTTCTNYILVDFENVQSQDVGLLKDGPFKVKVFLGPNQTKIPVSLAATLQTLGDNAEYISLEAEEIMLSIFILPITLDFYRQPNQRHSSLLKYLKGKKIFAKRSACISDIPYFKPALPAEPEAQVEATIADLVRRKASKPRTQKPC